MSIEQMIIVVTAAGGAIWALVKIVVPKMVEARIKAGEFSQTRDAARESQIFEMFGQVFEDLREERKQDREEREKDRRQMEELTNTIKDLSVQIIAKMDKNSSHIRILAQETAQLADRVSTFETKVKGENEPHN